MPHDAINFAEKLGLFSERWTPKVIAEMNDYQLKLVKLEGESGGALTAENDVWI